ncbi:hypothetical protein Q8A67_020275 [Cirrhinus molitorella]|uniref:Uncharacterized protein n=1 Tax=Cirrhinus molitorella TaxID=172907 RepID=A0AA88PCD3_9TELE|nr:hypothetical protein Q8A67_020275 [Cirrhinus molitorella]
MITPLLSQAAVGQRLREDSLRELQRGRPGLTRVQAGVRMDEQAVAPDRDSLCLPLLKSATDHSLAALTSAVPLLAILE